MIRPSRQVVASDLDIEAVLNESSLRLELMSEVRRRWDEGQPLDARAFLAEHPEFGSQKSVVLDLAFEEYCQKAETGELVDTDAYCRQFPTFEKSLRRLIAVQDFLEQNSHLMPMEVDWPEIGQMFQGFRVLTELGRGAFARVFLAQEVALGNRVVAVKVSTDGAGEAEILGRLRHPNIVPVYSVLQDVQTGLSLVCMPYLGRTTLCHLLDRLFGRETKPVKARSILEALRVDAEEFPVARDDACPIDSKLRSGSFVDGAAHLGRQLAEALAYSHSSGVCHSDLKPSNVLIGPGGKPMLLDFNLAFEPLSVERRLGGTLPYMAPEQLRALGASPKDWPPPVDERSDIFSLGVMLYELLAGSLPFGPVHTNRPRGEISARLLQRQELGPPALREANGDVDPPLAELVESCLAFHPDDRPQTAEKLAAALRRHASPAQRARRWTRRNALFVGLLDGSLLAVFGLVGYQWFTFSPVKAGWKHYEQGEYDEAEQLFTRAIESGDDLPAAYKGRGQSHHKSGRYKMAVLDYQQAVKLNPEGEVFACLAYCCGMDRKYACCIYYSEMAIEAGYDESPAVYNNLGRAYWLEGQLDLSLEALDRAIELDPSCVPALQNRAYTEFRRAVREQRLPNAQACADIDRAIKIASNKNPDLYLLAARIEWEFERQTGQYAERTVARLKHALEEGADRQMVREQFPSLLDDSTLKDLLETPARSPHRQRADTFIDPLP